MFIRTPRLEIYTRCIEENARSVINLCHSYGVQVACVTKVMSAHPAVVRALEAAGADMIADSRILNLQSMANTGMHLPADAAAHPGSQPRRRRRALRRYLAQFVGRDDGAALGGSPVPESNATR